MIQVRAFGQGEIRIGRKRITPATEMVFALALYLCVRAGERVTRDEVVEVFWGTGDMTKGRHSLRQMLYRLRQRGFVLDEETEDLFLDPERVECDLTRVLREEWPETADAAAVEESGLPTPSFARHVSDRFQEWYDGVRDRLARQHRRASLRQIAQARREGRWADLEVWGQHVLRTDPLNEEATLARAESAAMAGSKAMALEILDQYMEELGEHASKIGLPATVLRKRIAERRPAWAMRGPREVPLVGREELMARLTGMVDAAGRGEGRAVVLWGAPGVGKTRLAAEVSDYAQLSGFVVVQIAVIPTSPLSPRSLVLTLAAKARELPGAAGAHPAAMAAVERLLRTDLGEEFTPVELSSGNSAEIVRWAIQELLIAAAEEARILIVVDDCQNADSASERLCSQLSVATSDSRVAWITITRSKPVSPLERDASAAASSATIPVPPLDRPAAASLAAAVLAEYPTSLLPPSIDDIAEAAGGNPFFIRELAHHRRSSRSSEQLPQSLRALMDSRLDAMTSLDNRLLRLVSLLGEDASVSRVHALMGGTARDVSELIERAEALGIAFLSDSAHLALHDCWLQVVGDRLRGATRAALSLECARALIAADQPDARMSSVWRAAVLLSAAGEFTEASSTFAAAAEQLLRRGHVAQACDAFTRALATVDTDSMRRLLLSRLASACHGAGRFEDTLHAADELLRATPAFDENSLTLKLVARALIADALWRLQRPYQLALSDLAAAVQEAGASDEAIHFACLFGMRLAFNDRASPLEVHFFAASSSATARSGHSVTGQLTALIYHAERGTADEVREIDASLERIAVTAAVPSVSPLVLRFRSNALRWIGDVQRALVLAAEGYTDAVRLGLPDEATGFAQQLVFQHLDNCDEAAAEVWLSRCESVAGGRSSPTRDRALLHARARLCLQREQFEEVLDLYLPALSAITSDLVVKRRATDLSTLALAAANCDRRQLAEDLIDQTAALIAGEPPGHLIDYPVELAIRTLRIVGRHDDSSRIGRNYSTRRRNSYPRPLAHFCAELTLLEQALDSSSDVS